MKKFEYKKVVGALPHISEFNELGSKGWELIATEKDEDRDYNMIYTLFFKREIQ